MYAYVNSHFPSLGHNNNTVLICGVFTRLRITCRRPRRQSWGDKEKASWLGHGGFCGQLAAVKAYEQKESS